MPPQGSILPDAGSLTDAHTLGPETLAAVLRVDPGRGLDAAGVRERQVRHGQNRLPAAPPRTAVSVFLLQFRSPLVLALLVAALLAAAIGNFKDAAFILAVVLVNAIVGFVQEFRAEQSLAALRGMLPASTQVRREGRKIAIPAEALVPGDIVLLEAGDRVPADGRLLFGAGLEVDESALTGESVPAPKRHDLILERATPLADRSNMLYMNTALSRGRAELLVTAIGAETEMGRLSQTFAATVEPATPLQIQLDELGKRLGAVALVLVGILSFLELLRGTPLAAIVLDAIPLAVAAIPEGLPVVVTVTLALGMHAMARQRAIVKRLASVETLGCTTVICADKTGTLTMNQMTVRAFLHRGIRFEVAGEGYAAAGTVAPRFDTASDLLPGALVGCNDSRVDETGILGDPMEAALLVLARKLGAEPARLLARRPRLAEVPFDAAHKFMATFHREDELVRVFVKGAPDVLLPRCRRELTAGGEAPLSAAGVRDIEAAYAAFAAQAMRGLLIATRTIPAAAFGSGDLHALVADLTVVALVGLQDPARAEAKRAIALCREAGIRIKMITGDHPLTAAAIATELGLEGGAITGMELDGLDSRELGSRIDELAVFARVTPAHKVKIVRALQGQGHVVAMTGDGVNDAPALKAADIGVAMGIAGTAVAREAATMILVDDNFATLVSAVRQGRTLYDNIVKFVRFQLSTTFGAILTVFFAPLAGLPEPFTPVQILWVAIIMDGPPAVSLALDAARPGLMHEPPRRRAEPVLPLARLGRVFAYGVTMMVGTLGVLHFGRLEGMGERAVSLAFTTFVLFQFFNVFNARVERSSAFNRTFFANRLLWLSFAVVTGLQFVVIHWAPAQGLFGTRDLSLAEWGVAAAVASSVLVLDEVRKLIERAMHRARG